MFIGITLAEGTRPRMTTGFDAACSTAAAVGRSADPPVEAPVNANAVAAALEGLRPSLSTGAACGHACGTSPSFSASESEVRIFRRSIHSQVCISRPNWLKAVFLYNELIKSSQKSKLVTGSLVTTRTEG